MPAWLGENRKVLKRCEAKQTSSAQKVSITKETALFAEKGFLVMTRCKTGGKLLLSQSLNLWLSAFQRHHQSCPSLSTPGPVPTSTQGHKPQWGHSRAMLQLPKTLPHCRLVARHRSVPNLREVLSAPSATLLVEWRGRTGCSPYPQFLKKQNGFLIVLAIRKAFAAVSTKQFLWWTIFWVRATECARSGCQ